MVLIFDEELVSEYKSNSQKIRVMSETWVLKNCYCVKCGKRLSHHKNNKPIADFFCSNCGEDYELKSKNGNSNIICGGEYNTIIKKLEDNSLPNLLYLNYGPNYEVKNLIVIPKYYFSKSSIIARKPLASTARRSGWVGSYINIKHLPSSGKILIIRNSKFIDKKLVLYKYNKTLFLSGMQEKSKGWILEIMKCIDKLDLNEFTLNCLYDYEDELKNIYPNNNNIDAKIRQELQILRDMNYVESLGNGIYRRR